jgi:hypothetical protein
MEWYSPLVYDPDVDPSANECICAHDPRRTSSQDEDVDVRDIWRHDEFPEKKKCAE